MLFFIGAKVCGFIRQKCSGGYSLGDEKVRNRTERKNCVDILYNPISSVRIKFSNKYVGNGCTFIVLRANPWCFKGIRVK